MARGSVHPIPVERPFAVHEIFFSTTDRKGIIRSGNRVFTRVSGYTNDDLIGAPHNIIRHPDMPRVVFQLLWSEIGAGRSIAAYVKNMANDGTYYWVLATAMPVGDGYLSVRLKPTSPLLATVAALYDELRGIEMEIESRGGSVKEAMAASGERLMERLADLGFPDYQSFMYVALPTELRGFLEARGAAPAVPASARGTLAAALSACMRLRALLTREFSRLDRYDELEAAFDGKSETVLALADDIRLFSLNAQIGAARLRNVGAALGVIADIMRVRSDAVAGSVRAMSEAITGATDILSTLAFEVALATLQCETAHQFVLEVSAEDRDTDAALLAANVSALGLCLRQVLAPLGARLSALQGYLDHVGRGVDLLHEEMGRLEMLQVAGRVETARLREAGEFSSLFQEIRSQVETAKRELAELRVVKTLRRSRDNDGAADVIERELRRIEAWAHEALLSAGRTPSTASEAVSAALAA